MEKSVNMMPDKAAKLSMTLLLVGLSLGYFIVLLDMTVVSVALPAIRRDLGGGISGLQWVVNAYTITFAGLLLSMGAIADKWGAKRIYLIGLSLFLAASAISAAAQTLGSLIALRAILGVGGAAIMPASLSLIAHAFPDPSMRAKALGIWASVTGTAMAAGPIVGGILVDSFGWRSIFILQVPIAAISLFMTWRLFDETIGNKQRSIDLAGQFTAIAAITGLSFVLMEGGEWGWDSPIIIFASGVALLGAVLFVLVEAKSISPLLPLHVFQHSTVSAGMLAGLAINFALSGILFILPLFFQQIRGDAASIAGLSLLPLTLPLAFNPILTGKIVARIGAKLPMTAGFVFCAIGVLLLSRVNANTGYTITLFGLLLTGFGISFTIPSLIAAVISSLPKELSGVASGALNTSRQLGAMLGVAVMGTLLSINDTFTSGMRLAFLLTIVILLAGGALSFVFIGHKQKK